MTDRRPPGQPDLLPFQGVFVDAFTRRDSALRHLLIAPPGSGKTTVAAEIVWRLRDAGRLTRGLVLCPAALVSEYQFRLSAANAQPPALIVDRYRLREWEAETQTGRSPFPTPILAVMSIDLAKQPGVAAAVAATRWDLLLVDEAHLLVGQRVALVRQLLASGAVERVLLASASPINESLAGGFAITDWTSEIQAAVAEAAPAIHFNWLDVAYTDTEVAAMRAINELAAQLGRFGQAAIAGGLLGRACSSLYAAEQGILRLRNQAMHGGGAEFEEEAVAEAAGPRAVELASPEVIDRLQRTLSLLDRVERDSKVESLSTAVAEQVGDVRKTSVVVLSRYSFTVEYLSSTLTDRGIDARGVTEGTPVSDRLAAIDAASIGGVTIFTMAAVQSREFPRADVYMFYEQLKEHEIGDYALRLLREGRAGPIVAFSFRNPEMLTLPAAAET